MTELEKLLVDALLKIGGLAEQETSRIVGQIRFVVNDALAKATALRVAQAADLKNWTKS
jgi:hypothetical protein